MTTETVEPVHTFDQSSPVLAYWLTRCEGFEVTAGRRTGVVEKVALDRLDERADHLVVKFAGLRRVIVPSEAVRAVVPAEELLVLQPPEEPEPRLAPAAQRAKSDGVRAVRASARASAGAPAVPPQRGARPGARRTRRATARGASASGRARGRNAQAARCVLQPSRLRLLWRRRSPPRGTGSAPRFRLLQERSRNGRPTPWPTSARASPPQGSVPLRSTPRSARSGAGAAPSRSAC